MQFNKDLALASCQLDSTFENSCSQAYYVYLSSVWLDASDKVRLADRHFLHQKRQRVLNNTNNTSFRRNFADLLKIEVMEIWTRIA